ncbi:HK97-gp10 family putative phage morphogenesis protein [Halobacterium hubeiense]|uniref:hypothetical protein n=1 Tax=Halobacterium hubeiense TaxID=1407499 RepID=UPI000B7DAB42|nr:hypothetical protein [Halobacterium hubeiense]
MSWGVTVTGLDAVTGLFEDLTVKLEGDTVYVVGPTVEYAVYHETGTSKMEARPFARPAAERVQANLDQYVSNAPEFSEEAIVQQVAVGVESEMKRIITQKELVDTGAMRASVTIQKVQ